MVKAIFLSLLGLSYGAFAMPGEIPNDWRDELLKREGVENSKENLEIFLQGNAKPLQELSELFKQLSADNFPAREKAQKELLKGGEATLKWLRQREPSPDPETQRRLKVIMTLLDTAHRKDHEIAMEHSARSLLAEGDERPQNTGGLFYEWFGEDQKKLGETYRQFSFMDATERGGAILAGQLILPGGGGQDGDQRLILRSEKWPGEETFGETFQVSAKLRGESKGMGAWHLGITIGRVRALYHPGLDGGAFRFERIDNNDYLSGTESVGFTPGDEASQWMSVKVQRLPDKKIKLEVILTEGGNKEGRFETSIIVDAEEIGELNEVSLDRSGRIGGRAYFSDFMMKLTKE
ncbi:hypothetical protein V2O64_17670 [Verrucomicrobiaceae bacterium 227]